MAHTEILDTLQQGSKLSKPEMKRCMDAIMDGAIPDTAIATILTLLQKNGISADEIAGARESLIERATPITLDERAVDTCGTGGDSAGTFNISTAAALIANAAGVSIAKHGNRSVTSQCGSADVLEALGLPIELHPEATMALYRQTGFAFLYAPLYHPAMKKVAPIRKSLGIRTIFNILGPLLNPARVKRQLVGVFEPSLMELYAEALRQSGCSHALIVHGETESGLPLDEASVSGRTHIIELQNNVTCRHTTKPTDFHLQQWPIADLAGGTREENALLITRLLEGKATQAQREAALFAAAIACYVSGNANCIDEGICMAKEALAERRALRNLEAIIEISRDLERKYGTGKN
ncbi:anthranilate phosphoribosyltransferase [Chlorobium phaeovibrioides]|uniref:Anthranilate phosphoribosyltransferase n=1 Tax=Chlorobium phaeovibrioides TaxID=1094 RepID=A0A5M8ICA5_CHLPH|nr:anthranilate phosphoribosyltransferase [Chlorobium phaeovibrioides]KAA6233023.1 anthranilate phosphoribosyltransferase [Chlorobium phaeovibrioides]RTY35884.1 anthranilate phosphoribosyltransferase [Chlorobium phaeovibrioides]